MGEQTLESEKDKHPDCTNCSLNDILIETSIYQGFEIRYHTYPIEDNTIGHVVCMHLLENKENYARVSERENPEILDVMFNLINLGDIRKLYGGIPNIFPVELGPCQIHPHEQVLALNTIWEHSVQSLEQYLRQSIDGFISNLSKP